MGNSWRPKDWRNHFSKRREEDGIFSRHELFEAGADALLEALMPLLRTAHEQLLGKRAMMPVEPGYSELDACIDRLGEILRGPSDRRTGEEVKE